MPVLHAGYRHLFERHPTAKLYLLGRDITAPFRPLTKDLRALDPLLVKSAIEAWDILPGVEIAVPQTLKTLAKSNATLVMPDEDISRDLADQYFPDRTIEYSPIFLRWDRRRSEAQEMPPASHVISTSAADQAVMNLAHQEGMKSSDIWRRVGAVIVRDGEVALHSYNRAQPTDATPWTEGDPRNNFGRGVAIEMSLFIHAESALIAQAAREGLVLAGASMYVTTFPCPNCAKLIAAAGITKCYYVAGYAMLDGSRILEANGVDIIRVDTKLADPPEEIWVPYPENPQ